MSKTDLPFCRHCGEPLVVDRSLCGWCAEEWERKALVALTRPAPDCSFAIFFLRDQGYSAEQVLQAREEMLEGGFLERVHARLRAPVGETVAT